VPLSWGPGIAAAYLTSFRCYRTSHLEASARSHDIRAYRSEAGSRRPPGPCVPAALGLARRLCRARWTRRRSRLNENHHCRICRAVILPATAERTAGLCMPCAKDPARAEPTRIAQRARETPARCLSGFSVTLNLSLVPFKDRRQSVPFELSCRCGARAFEILGFYVPATDGASESMFVGPLALRCSVCGAKNHLMDPRHDGYDGELGDSAGITGEGERCPYSCVACQSRLFQVSVVLEYSVEDEEMQDWPDLAARPQDFFTGFSLLGRCDPGEHSHDIVSYECA
jgi:hypothetical protein